MPMACCAPCWLPASGWCVSFPPGVLWLGGMSGAAGEGALAVGVCCARGGGRRAVQKMLCRPLLGSSLPPPPCHTHTTAVNSQLLATYWELPVSTTHAIVGAVVGMTMVSAGPAAVNWSEHTDSFPFLGVRLSCYNLGCGGAAQLLLLSLGRWLCCGLPCPVGAFAGRPPPLLPSTELAAAALSCTPTPSCSSHLHLPPLLQGVSSILLSWLFSPLLTGVLALVLFVVLRALVLRSPQAYHRAYYVLPVFVMATFFMRVAYCTGCVGFVGAVSRVPSTAV